MKKLLLLSIISLAFACKKQSSPVIIDATPLQKELSIQEKIAVANGFDQWKNVRTISFTFNVDRSGKTYFRKWQWNPKKEKVTMITLEDTISYYRNQMDSIAIASDRAFINDRYWLFTPYNFMWDKGTSFSIKQDTLSPVKQEKLHKLVLTYGDEGGYTPGDAYDFYYDDDFIIREWAFRKNNQKDISLATTWEDYRDFNGLKLSMSRKTANETFHLFFTDIIVE